MKLGFITFALISIFLSQAAIAQQQPPQYALEPVTEGVYRFVAGNYRSIVVVGDNMLAITDPISPQAATWLKPVLAERFKQPLRYMIYSHSHPDHTYGGEVFSDGSIRVVAHALAAEEMQRSRAQTRLPDLTFTDSLTLDLGGRSIKLQYHGANNGYGSVSMRISPDRVLHVVDWIVVGRLPYRDFKGYDINGMIHSTQAVLEYDFDTFIGGHAEMGNKQDVRHYLDYLTSLYEAVLTGMLAGKSLTQLQQEISLPEFKDIPKYDDWFALNVEGVYNTLDNSNYVLIRPEVKAITTD